MNQPITVAGAGLAELPIPFWLRLARAGLALGISSLIFTSVFVLSGWRWVTDAGADGFSAGFAVASAALVTFAVGVPFALARAGFFNLIVNIRRGSDGKPVFGGFRSAARPVAILALLGLLLGLTGLLANEGIRSCPLPELLSKVHYDILAPRPADKMVPVYFWDYATWVDPAMLDHVNIVVPYEKGPPQKLLPKIFFEDSGNHAIVLELHGRRPRSYSPTEVLDLFDSTVAHPRDWPLLWRLEREAGLAAEGMNAPILYLVRLNQGTRSQVTQAIGVPWDTSGSTPRPENGRLFFWGPDGSVFQVKCASPCTMARTLELIQFPPDPRGSHADRLEWTKATLKKLLEAAEAVGGAKPEAGPERARQDNLLSLYLVSLLTLDPKDPEAFFHLGKLARNRETILSAIRYGRDLGMEHAKIVELEAVADRLSL